VFSDSVVSVVRFGCVLPIDFRRAAYTELQFYVTAEVTHIIGCYVLVHTALNVLERYT